MLREFESPAYLRIVFYLGLAIAGMALVVSRFVGSISIRDQFFSWLQ